MNPREKKLLTLFRSLNAENKDFVVDFVKFLSARQSVETESLVQDPLKIPRPESESVVGAMKRLTKTYPMIDTRNLITAASSLMTQHIVQGRDTGEIIGELEALFREHYERMRDEKQ